MYCKVKLCGNEHLWLVTSARLSVLQVSDPEPSCFLKPTLELSLYDWSLRNEDGGTGR
jgi:hypothetical protein